MVDFPSQILTGNFAFGYESGWDFSDAVTVTRMSNGATVTSINRPPLRVMNFTGANQTLAGAQAIEAMKRTVGGTAGSFLFKDPAHYALTNHLILTAAGGETTVQAKEVFGTYSWDIRHLVSGTLVVKRNGATLGGASVNSTGLITFGVTLSAADTITITCEFYTPVRFVRPLSATRVLPAHGSIGDLDLIEAFGE